MENALNYAALDAAKNQAETYQKELGKLNGELEHLALYDSLTNLPNRSLIMDRLEQALLSAARDEKPLAIIMADLDHFKEVNDSLGHAVGDSLLQAVGVRLKAGVRKSDTVGRLGGDEFAIVMPHADIHAAVSVAMELQSTLESPFELDAASISIAASMGIAMFPDHGNDTVTLLKHADVAMYTAKRTKNGYAVYNRNEDDNVAGKLGRLGELRNALHSNEFVLYYQPIVDLTTGQVIGTEALTRWPRDGQAMIMPDEFIPALEQTGLIRPFTLWVIDSALAQCAAWHKEGLDLSVAVNISAHSLLDAQLAGQIADFLARWAVPADALVLEITESAFMGDVPRVQRILNQIRDLGVRISIDDFGTGYSSLAHLKRLPVGQLKIDRSFIMNMQNAGDDATIVHSTVDLAHNLGLRVVAEGVEDNEILQRLTELGCDMIQGYHICRPMPPDEMLRFLREGRWCITRAPHDKSNKSG
jgi:diguanylate cyclase (GGDEF)-like protein